MAPLKVQPLQPAVRDSSSKSNTIVAPSAQTGPINATLAVKNLAKLGSIIETELKAWVVHLQSISSNSTYESLTSNGITPSARSAALIHILEALPARHQALASAYNAEETEQIELSDQCATLLEQVKNSGITSPDSGRSSRDGLDLTGYYDHKLFKGKRFRADVLAQDKEIAELEQKRLEELEELMTMFEEMKILWEEGWLQTEQVELLVEAMDDVGLRASSALQAGGDGEKEGVVQGVEGGQD